MNIGSMSFFLMMIPSLLLQKEKDKQGGVELGFWSRKKEME